ncbi:MAG: LysM peptidoglycan-binding domain-containing protein [Planctomycetota bacterium]|jgi:nucleoid-associated protein YgaU
MGTFEKLGVLVIVVIIVMILAVAIYQWGGAATEPVAAAPELPDPLTIRYLDELDGERAESPPPDAAVTPDADTWPGDIPKRYTIAPNDRVWVLVVKRWHLKESFIPAIAAANPRANLQRLRPGQTLVIPDPSAYLRGATTKSPRTRGRGTRRYEVQIGDTLESIAFRHLGSRQRWPDIISLNPGLNPKRLQEGQEIILPVR